MILSIFDTYFLPAIILAAAGGLFGVLIAICAKVFYVKEDERVEEITSMLPGYNCGACGYPGCGGLAIAIVDGKAVVTVCGPIKDDQAESIMKYLKEANAKIKG